MIVKHIKELIGNTPLLELDSKVHGIKNVKIYAKLELFNPYGSLKDRIALNMLDIDKAKGKTVIESSTGNTAKALAYLTSSENLKFKNVSNTFKDPEIRQILQLLETELQELPGHSECPDPNDPNNTIKTIEKTIASSPDSYFHTDQFFNKKNIEAHEQSGKEIVKDLNNVDYFFSYMGTCGSSLGIGNILKNEFNTNNIGIYCEEGGYVPGGRSENELFETGFYNEKNYDEVIKGTMKGTIQGMIELNRKYGIPCGPASGLNYSTMIDYLSKQDFKEEISVVFIVCDRVESYMTYLQRYAKDLFSNKEESNRFILDVDHDEMMMSSEIKYEDIPKNALLIDIRSNYSFNYSSIPGSMNINSFMFEELLKQKNSFPKDKPIVLICSKGLISKKYVAYLEREG
ncbi:MAG: pyridoxal-phosphate dependent enzyme, partial [Methanosarcinales archaeon]|nr:pyridoxal-phosphate dependent enzyme [Methanosarcinales archaeon]